MKKFCLILGITAVLFLMQSCASIFTPSKYPVSFNSNPTDASVKVTNRYGMLIFSGTTPAIVVLNASEGFFTKASYTVEYSKPGYESVVFPLIARIDGWYFGNILIGGLLGMLIIDPATGAMWKLDDYVHVEMLSLRSENSFGIMDINDIPEEMRGALVQLR